MPKEPGGGENLKENWWKPTILIEGYGEVIVPEFQENDDYNLYFCYGANGPRGIKEEKWLYATSEKDALTSFGTYLEEKHSGLKARSFFPSATLVREGKNVAKKKEEGEATAILKELNQKEQLPPLPPPKPKLPPLPPLPPPRRTPPPNLPPLPPKK